MGKGEVGGREVCARWRTTLHPQVVGVLDLLLGLLQASPAQDSLAVSLLEPGNIEVLLALLVRPGSPPLLPDRVCKVHPAPWHLKAPEGCAFVGLSCSHTPVW